MTAEDLKKLCEDFKKKIKQVLKRPFPDDPKEQLSGAIGAVFKSWQGKRAVSYRRIEGIPEEWGTACNVQSMVFGNMGDHSATGVAFSRNPATGENKFYGEWLVNAQGEDVVAGIRTPSPINEATKNEQNKHLTSLEHAMPELYKELYDIRTRLEHHYRDMQDIEFTIENQKLYMLQCRNGKRTGTAALNMAMDMLHEKLIDEIDRGDPRRAGPVGRVAAPDHRPGRREGRRADRFRPARRTGRSQRQDRSHLRRGGGMGRPRREGDPGPRRDKPGGRRRHAGRRGHPYRSRRHDQPRGAGGPRLGQVLHRRRRRSEHRLRRARKPRRATRRSAKAT